MHPKPILRGGLSLLAAATLSFSAGPAVAGELPSIPTVVPGQEQPVFHAGAPVPTPFGAGDYVGYVSDISSYPGGAYLEVVKGFPALKANAEVMAANNAQAIAINNSATPEQIAQAQRDALADQDGVVGALSTAFGSTVGEQLRTALAEHRLPKTQMLLNAGWFARAGGIASSMFVEKAIYANPRPFVALPDQVRRYPIAEREIYLSSKSFPSGHTNQATWVATLLAAMFPEAAPQLLARASDYSHNRIVLGVHYPLDVIAGRMTGTAAAADRWNDPKMRANLLAAAEEIRQEIAWRCGMSLKDCMAKDAPYSADPVAVVTQRQAYGFSPLGAVDAPMLVPQAAPDLLITAFPQLNWEQRRQVLAATASPAGYPLDDPQLPWARINLARAFAAQVTVNPDGSVMVRG